MAIVRGSGNRNSERDPRSCWNSNPNADGYGNRNGYRYRYRYRNSYGHRHRNTNGHGHCCGNKYDGDRLHGHLQQHVNNFHRNSQEDFRLVAG